jgi:hypothetical protein
MYHEKIIPNGVLLHKKIGEIALRAYLSEHEEALGHAAVMLGGRRGARLINAIREALAQPGPLTRRLRCNLLDLRRLLFLELDYDENWSDEACFTSLEPDDPIVPEICLLADTFDEALQDAGLNDIGNGRTA